MDSRWNNLRDVAGGTVRLPQGPAHHPTIMTGPHGRRQCRPCSRTIYQQPSPDEVHAQLDRVTDQLQDRFPQVASLLDGAGPDILAFSSFPVPHWKKIWSNNPQERLNKEIRRRERRELGSCFRDRRAYLLCRRLPRRDRYRVQGGCSHPRRTP